MPLLKTKNNIIGFSALGGTERVNIDGLRTDGTYTISDTSGGGTFPDTATFSASLVVSSSGDTQTLTDASSTVFTRSFGLEWWGVWA